MIMTITVRMENMDKETRYRNQTNQNPQLCHMLPVLPSAKGQQRPDIRHVLQTFQEGYQIHQVAVCGVADPALYRDCVVYSGWC